MSTTSLLSQRIDDCIGRSSYLLKVLGNNDTPAVDSLEDCCGRLKIVWHDLCRSGFEKTESSDPALYNLALQFSENLSRRVAILLGSVLLCASYADHIQELSYPTISACLTQASLVNLSEDIELLHRFAQHAKRLLIRDALKTKKPESYRVDSAEEVAGYDIAYVDFIEREFPQASQSLKRRLIAALLERRGRFISCGKQRLNERPSIVSLILPYWSLVERSMVKTARKAKLPETISQASISATSSQESITRHLEKEYLDVSPHIIDQFPPFPTFANLQGACCPFCFDLFSASGIVDEQSWNVHVQNDFGPYPCVFDDCQTSTPFFSTIQDWIAHVKQDHSLQQWRCASRSHGPQVFATKIDFVSHMRQCHARSCPEKYLPSMIKRCVWVQPVRLESCPLCCSVLASGSFDHIVSHLTAVAYKSFEITDGASNISSDKVFELFWSYDYHKDVINKYMSDPSSHQNEAKHQSGTKSPSLESISNVAKTAAYQSDSWGKAAGSSVPQKRPLSTERDNLRNSVARQLGTVMPTRDNIPNSWQEIGRDPGLASTGQLTSMVEQEAAMKNTSSYDGYGHQSYSGYLDSDDAVDLEEKHLLFCTFDGCYRTFRSIGDLRRHEMLGHIAEKFQGWRCFSGDVPTSKSQIQCSSFFHDMEEFVTHRELEHFEREDSSTDDQLKALSSCFVKQGMPGDFWCGFCAKSVINVFNPTDGTSRDKFRYNHIYRHIHDEKRDMSGWLELLSNLPKDTMRSALTTRERQQVVGIRQDQSSAVNSDEPLDEREADLHEPRSRWPQVRSRTSETKSELIRDSQGSSMPREQKESRESRESRAGARRPRGRGEDIWRL